MYKMLSPAFIFSVFFVFQCTAFSVLSQEIRHWDKKQDPGFYLEKFIGSSDTSELKSALLSIKENRSLLTSKMVKLLHQAEKEAGKSHSEVLPYIYPLLITYYMQEDNRPKYLEYLLLHYNLMNEAGNLEEIKWLLVDIGNLFVIEEDYSQGLGFYKEAETIAWKHQDRYALTVIYLNYGLIADYTDQYREALRYYKKAFHFKAMEGNPDLLSTSYIGEAEVYYHLRMPDSVLYYTHLTDNHYSGLTASEKELQPDMPSLINRSYANYHRLTGNNQKALAYLQKAKQYCLEQHIDYEYFTNVYSEVEVLYRMNQFQRGIRLMKETLQFSKEKGMFPEQKLIWEKIAFGYQKLKDYPKATEAYENYKLISDSLEKLEYKSNLNIMRTILTVFKKDLKLKQANRKLELEEVENRQRIREIHASYFIIAIVIILMAMLTFLYVTVRKNKRKLENFHEKLVHQNNNIVENTIQLEKSNEIRDKLFSVIAHDLRNPLNRLLVEFSLLEKSLPPNAASNAMITLKETISLFESLLLWSKMENKETIFSPARIELDANIEKVIHFFSSEMQSKNITLSAQIHHYAVFADPNILQTILRNLVSNAASVLEENGKIEIRQVKLENDFVELAVSDSGPGFSEEIFRKFYSEEEDKSIVSKGFGLTLCKTLARVSRWRIDISNNEDGGATVHIIIPLYKERNAIHRMKPAREINLSEEWKEKLSPLSAFKHYQTSEIRKFIKSLGKMEDENVNTWITYLEVAVHEANAQQYRDLLKVLEKPALLS